MLINGQPINVVSIMIAMMKYGREGDGMSFYCGGMLSQFLLRENVPIEETDTRLPMELPYDVILCKTEKRYMVF